MLYVRNAVISGGLAVSKLIEKKKQRDENIGICQEKNRTNRRCFAHFLLGGSNTLKIRMLLSKKNILTHL